MGRQCCLYPGDIPVMVCSPYVYGLPIPFLELLKMVGNICRKIGKLPAPFPDYTVFVVPEEGGPYPCCTILFIKLPLLAQ